VTSCHSLSLAKHKQQRVCGRQRCPCRTHRSTAASTCCASAPWTIATFGRLRIRQRRPPPTSASRRSWRCHVRCHPRRPRPTTLLSPPTPPLETSHRSVSFFDLHLAVSFCVFCRRCRQADRWLHCSAACFAPPRATQRARGASRKQCAPGACNAVRQPAAPPAAGRIFKKFYI